MQTGCHAQAHGHLSVGERLSHGRTFGARLYGRTFAARLRQTLSTEPLASLIRLSIITSLRGGVFSGSFI